MGAGRLVPALGALSRHASGVDASNEGSIPAATDRSTPGSAATTSRRAAAGASGFARAAANDQQRHSNGDDKLATEIEQSQTTAAASAQGVGHVNSHVGKSAVVADADKGRSKQFHGTGTAAEAAWHQQPSKQLDWQAQAHRNSHDGQKHGTDTDWLESTQEILQQEGAISTGSLPELSSTLVREPVKSGLKSQASMFAASGVVDELYTERQTYVNGGAEPMTRQRHQFGLSPREMQEEREKRKEFADNLAAWYKLQLQRRLRNNASGVRVISRSNSREQ